MSDIATRADSLPAEATKAPTSTPSGLAQWADQARIAGGLAQSLTQTSFCPQKYRGKPAEAAAAILAGGEMGLSPIASLNAFDDIQGTPAPKAMTLWAVALSQGHHLRIVESSATRAVARGRRVGEPDDREQESVWTIERAQQAGLTGKSQWKNQPENMLIARVKAELARMVASDVLLGVPYSAEERFDMEPERVVRSTSRPRSVIEAVQQRETPAEHFEAAEPDADPETGEIEDPWFDDQVPA